MAARLDYPLGFEPKDLAVVHVALPRPAAADPVGPPLQQGSQFGKVSQALLPSMTSTAAMKLWTGSAHFQDLAVQVRAVESDDCHFRFGIGLHLNKSESSG
jgi:hypothetical protein